MDVLRFMESCTIAAVFLLMMCTSSGVSAVASAKVVDALEDGQAIGTSAVAINR